MRSPDHFFSPLEACRAVGLARGTLDTWTAKGLTKSFQGQSIAVGKARAFPTADVLALGLIKEAHSIGVQAPELYSVAPNFARMFLGHSGRIRELVMRFYGAPGSEDTKISCAPNDDALSQVPAPGARITIIFNLIDIFGPILKSLDEMRDDNKQS